MKNILLLILIIIGLSCFSQSSIKPKLTGVFVVDSTDQVFTQKVIAPALIIDYEKKILYLLNTTANKNTTLEKILETPSNISLIQDSISESYVGKIATDTIKLYEPVANGTNFTAFKSQAQVGNITYTLPATDGSSGTALTTNGSGTLAWSGYPAQEQIYSFNVLLDADAVNGLGTAYQIVEAPAAGYSIEVISCSISLTVSVQLEVGTQTLNLWVYTVGSAQFTWSNAIIESASSVALRGFAPSTGYHKSASPLMLQLSSVSNPSSGSATIRISGIYRIVQL